MKVVYLPDGAAKTVSVGKRNLAFKKSSPNNLLITGELSGLAIQAVNTIGQRKIDEKTLEKIQGIVKQEKRADILNNAKLSPAWINKLVMQVL